MTRRIPPRLSALLWSLGIAAAYVGTGRFCLSLASVHPSSTAVWIPTGLSIAAVLLLGRPAVPAVFAGAFIVNALTKGTVATWVGIAAGNTLEAVIGAALIRRCCGGASLFERSRDVFNFAVLTATLATAVSATVGVASLCATGFADWVAFGPIWFTWWLGDVGSALIVAPFLILAARGPGWPWGWPRLPEYLMGAAATVLTGLFVFTGPWSAAAVGAPIAFLCLPPLVWTAFRFGPRETAALTLVLTAIATACTLQGRGPFVHAGPNESLLLLEAFMAVASLTSLVLAAAVTERRAMEAGLKRNEAELLRHVGEIERLNETLAGQKRELTTFHGLVTHDVTNFCATLQAIVERLLLKADGPLGPRQEELVRRANRQAFEMNRLADNAKLLSRLREKGLPPAEGRLRLADILNRAVDIVHEVHFDRDFRVEIECPPDLEISGIPFVENVFLNIVDNAVRHGPRDAKPVIRVLAEPAEARVSVVIRGGSTVDDQMLARVFDRFAPGPHSTGAGLGLAVIREIVEQAGGSVEARNAAVDGQGTFEIKLRLPGGPPWRAS